MKKNLENINNPKQYCDLANLTNYEEFEKDFFNIEYDDSDIDIFNFNSQYYKQLPNFHKALLKALISCEKKKLMGIKSELRLKSFYLYYHGFKKIPKRINFDMYCKSINLPPIKPATWNFFRKTKMRLKSILARVEYDIFMQELTAKFENKEIQTIKEAIKVLRLYGYLKPNKNSKECLKNFFEVLVSEERFNNKDDRKIAYKEKKLIKDLNR